MDEIILIKSEKYNVKTLCIILVIIGLIISAFMIIDCISSEMDNFDLLYYDYEEIHYLHQRDGCTWRHPNYKCIDCENYEGGQFAYAIDYTFYTNNTLILLSPFIGLSLIACLLYLWLRSYELTVTNKRIYGKIAWGKRVDLPVDSISATATSILKGISVSTSSGKICFVLIKNASKIYNIINGLLIERQQEIITPTPIIEEPKLDEIDKIKKYKELLDSGIITQEEFDAKKKQLLGL